MNLLNWTCCATFEDSDNIIIIRLPVMAHFISFGFMRPGDLDLWPLDLEFFLLHTNWPLILSLYVKRTEGRTDAEQCVPHLKESDANTALCMAVTKPRVQSNTADTPSASWRSYVNCTVDCYWLATRCCVTLKSDFTSRGATRFNSRLNWIEWHYTMVQNNFTFFSFYMYCGFYKRWPIIAIIFGAFSIASSFATQSLLRYPPHLPTAVTQSTDCDGAVGEWHKAYWHVTIVYRYWDIEFNVE